MEDKELIKYLVKQYMNLLKTKNKYVVYKYTNKITRRVYIGSSIDICGRYLYHLNRNESDLDKDITKYGIENFKFEILAAFKRKDDYQNFEKQVIREYNNNHIPLYNKVLYNNS